MIIAVFGVLLAAAWLYVTVGAAVGMPRVTDVSASEWDQRLNEKFPRVSIIVPARNEEHMIETAIRSLLQIDYPDFEIVAVDDRSTDKTGEILDAIATGDPKLRVVHVSELPQGWLGKTHAMAAASDIATGEWLLFTDADVVHHPEALRRAVAYAKHDSADHVVLMPTMLLYTWGERMMISLFQALFLFAHRPWKVADPKSKDHIGVGAFNLVRRSVYDAIGGYAKLRMAIVDDMKLGEHIKAEGYAQRNIFGRDLVRIHWAAGAIGIVHNLTKNFFAELKYNVWYAMGATFTMLILQLTPWVGTIFAPGWSRLPYAVSLACIVFIYFYMERRSTISPVYVLLHPLATVLMFYAMLRSTIVTLVQGGVVWRGTKYSLAELRQGN